MKIYYIGNICSEKEYNKIVSESRRKPSVAGLVFESMLLHGLKQNGAEIDVRTYLNLAAFPQSKKIIIPHKTEQLKSGYNARWIPSINLPYLKQIIYKIMSYIDLKSWIRENKNEEKAILTYSIYDFMTSAALKLGKKHNIPICAVVPDLPSNHFELVKTSGVKSKLSRMFIKGSIEKQDCFDSYVFFTEQMNNVVNKNNRPYTIVEGICDENTFSKYSNISKYEKKAIMYAGMLGEIHRVGMIAKAFMKVKGDYELWFFGSGNYEEQLKKLANQDERIKIFGRVPRETVLENEKRASLMINVRDSKEQYTAYSFPSKTMEYMASGTPLLTTRLPGIPEEYFNYVYTLDDETIEGLAKKLSEILSKDYSELDEMGQKGKKFVLENKNTVVQAKKIYVLMRKMSDEDIAD